MNTTALERYLHRGLPRLMLALDSIISEFAPQFAQDAQFKEQEHPRAKSGEFTSGGGSAGGGTGAGVNFKFKEKPSVNAIANKAIAEFEKTEGRKFDRRGNQKKVTEIIHRLSVNYIRHALTDYDEQIKGTPYNPEGDEKRRTLHQKLFSAIAEAFPGLRAEARRQLQKKHPDLDLLPAAKGEGKKEEPPKTEPKTEPKAEPKAEPHKPKILAAGPPKAPPPKPATVTGTPRPKSTLSLKATLSPARAELLKKAGWSSPEQPKQPPRPQPKQLTLSEMKDARRERLRKKDRAYDSRWLSPRFHAM